MDSPTLPSYEDVRAAAKRIEQTSTELGGRRIIQVRRQPHPRTRHGERLDTWLRRRRERSLRSSIPHGRDFLEQHFELIRIFHSSILQRYAQRPCDLLGCSRFERHTVIVFIPKHGHS